VFYVTDSFPSADSFINLLSILNCPAVHLRHSQWH